MKICIIAMSGIYPIHIGGPANVAYFLAREFGRLGNPTTVFVRVRNQKELSLIDNIPELNIQNVKVIPIKINYDIKTFLNIPLLVYKISNFSKQLYEEDYNVILYNSPPVDIALLSPIISKLKRAKQVIIFHGYGGLYDSKNVLHKVGRLLIKTQIEWFGKAIIVSNFSREIPSYFGFEENKIEFIPNGVDPDLIDAVEEPLDLLGSPKILYVGRLAAIKGVNKILQVFSIVVKKFSDAHVYIVGEGPEETKLKQLSNSLGIMDNVHFEGFKPPGKDVYRYYKSSDLFVMASQKEGACPPIAIIEAMASGLPCIVSDIPGLRIVEDAKCGIVVNFNNVEKAAEKIVEYLKRGDPCHSRNAREYAVKNLDWKIIAGRYLEEFRNLI